MRRPLTLALLAVFALTLAGCGAESVRRDGSEGAYLDVGPLTYQVQNSRYMNPNDVEDKAYLAGLPQSADLGANELWFGIFMRVQNYSDRPATSTTQFVIRDTQGNVYKPVPLDAKVNPFAYAPSAVQPGDIYPPVSSVAGQGPVQQGSLLLFRIKTTSTQNRPLELFMGSGPQLAIMQLDV